MPVWLSRSRHFLNCPGVQTAHCRPGSRIVAITSGKGGVGKTSLTVNLAAALSGMGNRVIIFDADLGLANAEVILGMTPRYSLFDFLFGDKSLSDIIVEGPHGIRLVSGGSGFLELANLDNRRRQKILEALNYVDQDADFVLIDTAAGISRNVLGFVAAAGEVIVVITPEPTSLTDAYSLIKILSKFNLHNEVLLVVNKAVNESEAVYTARRIEIAAEKFLNIKIKRLGFVREDRVVTQAVKSQQLFVTGDPFSVPARNVNSIARVLIDKEANNEKKGFGFKTFVNKLVRLFG